MLLTVNRISRGFFSGSAEFELETGYNSVIRVQAMFWGETPEKQTRDYPGSPGGVSIISMHPISCHCDEVEVTCDSPWWPVVEAIVAADLDRNRSMYEAGLREEVLSADRGIIRA